MQKKIEERRVQNRRNAHVLAGGCGSRHSEDASADYRPDTERDQTPGPERPLEPLTFDVRFRNQRVDALGLEELIHRVLRQYSGKMGRLYWR